MASTKSPASGSAPGLTLSGLSATGKDRRRHARRSMTRACKLRHAEALRYASAQTRDLSEGGALLTIETTRPLSQGQDITIAIDFEGRAILTQSQMIEAKVVRAGPVLNHRQTIAVAFRTAASLPGVAAVA